MKCLNCGHEMEATAGNYHYTESGLDDIILGGVTIFRCLSCKETEVEIPCLEELHQLIAFTIVFSPRRLQGKEARFLRKHLGYTAEELAQSLGVSRVNVTRWETGKIAFRVDHDKALRRFYMSKRGQELQKYPQVLKALSALVDRLPLPKPKTSVRLHKEDWVTCSV